MARVHILCGKLGQDVRVSVCISGVLTNRAFRRLSILALGFWVAQKPLCHIEAKGCQNDLNPRKGGDLRSPGSLG